MDKPRLIIKLKHVNIYSYWLRQEVQANIIKLKYIETSLLVTDKFIKELPKQKHKKFVRQLNLVDIKEKLKK